MSQSFMSAAGVGAPQAMPAPPGILVSALSEVLRGAVGLLGHGHQLPSVAFVTIPRSRNRGVF